MHLKDGSVWIRASIVEEIIRGKKKIKEKRLGGN